MFESLTITGTLWYQFVDRTSSLTFVSGLYIIIIGSSVELQMPRSKSEVVGITFIQSMVIAAHAIA